MNLTAQILNNQLSDHLIISNYNKKLINSEVVVGIDEAGRGPVLGPMIYSAFFCLASEENKLISMKCADSKLLNKAERERIFEEINQDASDFCGYCIKIDSPNTISNKMLRKEKYNLNQISHDAAICLIEKLIEENFNLKIVFLDTVGDSIKYQNLLKNRFPKLNVKVSKKADSLYPVVSASSICAKVTRDFIVENWNFVEKIEKRKYGSGYPGDPETKEFLDDTCNKIFAFTTFVRFSWSTILQKIVKKCVEVNWNDSFVLLNENEENGNEDAFNTQKKSKKLQKMKPTKDNLSILNFFQKSVKRPRENNCIQYFTNDRKIFFLRSI